MSEDRWVDDGGQIDYNIYHACAGRKRSRQERKFTSRNRLSAARFVNTFLFSTVQTVLTEVKGSSSVVVHVFCVFISRVISEDLY